MILRAVLLTALTIPSAWGCGFGFSDEVDKIRDYVVRGPGAEGISTPRDINANKTIYREALPLIGNKMVIICPLFSEKLGIQINPAIGVQPNVGTSLFRLKDSGVALQFSIDSSKIALVPVEFSDLKILNKTEIPTPTPEVRIVQTGPIKDGTIIPAGRLASLMTSDGSTFATFNLTNAIRIVGGACITPDVDVDMGHTTKTSQFKKVGDHSDPVDFIIQLRDCPNFLNTVKYSIKANTQVIDKTNGIVSLDSTSSARGIGLQVKRDNDQPLVFGTEYTFSEYNRAGGNFVIPFSAAYTQVSPSIEAGAANSSLTFTMSYQ
ncbi:fimbrial protein [Pseudomonas sp. FP2196]|uniref:fimbrial protein n=1 Tax=Pseudomonas sp. FP2196 TaxID=2954086 RepID=UPI0027347BD5|nr:fimbrial protein [Pseudomonas sp. FP2196]WLH33118.1 fimbrial protein [Pseudomonas sp. FP2196]